MSGGGKDPLSDGLAALFRGLGKMLRLALQGIRKLRKPLLIVGLILTLFLCVASTLAQAWLHGLESIGGINVPLPIRYLFGWLLQATPFLYLVLLGSITDKHAEEYESIFLEIGFVGKDKKPPYFIGRKEEGKKTTLTFRSNLPLVEWKKARESLETALDCSIRQVLEGGNKKTVQLVTVSSDFKIPAMIVWDDAFLSDQDGEVVLGESDLERIRFNFNRAPHVLAAGEPGSGKSVMLRMLLWQLLNQGCRAYMIDFKGGVEFGKAYERFGEVITERDRACEVLAELVAENGARLKLFRDLEVKNLWEYNFKTHSNLCRIAVVIDEVAEMLDRKGVPKDELAAYEQLEGMLSTLARLSRATGINLLLGTQRPDAKILPGQIKNNVPVRISGRFADRVASEIVLGSRGACELPDVKGRFLYKVSSEIIEFQAFYFDDDKHLHDLEVEPGDMLTGPNGEENSFRAAMDKLQPTRKPRPPVQSLEPAEEEPPAPWTESELDEEADSGAGLDGLNDDLPLNFDFDEEASE